MHCVCACVCVCVSVHVYVHVRIYNIGCLHVHVPPCGTWLYTWYTVQITCNNHSGAVGNGEERDEIGKEAILH